MVVANGRKAAMLRAGGLVGVTAFAAVTCLARPASAQEIPSLTQPAIVRQSRVVLAVEDRDSSKRVTEAASAVGGQLVRADDAEAIVDVPTESYRALLERLRAIGQLESERVASDDVSEGVVRSRASARAASARRKRLDELQPKAASVADRLLLEREVEAAEQSRASAERAERELLHRSGIVRVAIRFRWPEVEPLESPTLPFDWLDRLGLEVLQSPSEVAPSRRGSELRSYFELAALLRGGYVRDREPVDDVPVFGAGVIRFRTLGEATPVGLFGGFDLSLGAGGGVLFGLQSLLGAGVALGDRLAIGLATGPGVDGVTGVVPTALTLPVELDVSLDLATWLGVTMWVQDGWVVRESRTHGSENALWGDELAAGLLVSPNRSDSSVYTVHRQGWLFGVGYRELLGTRIFELSFGWGAHESDFSGHY